MSGGIKFVRAVAGAGNQEKWLPKKSNQIKRQLMTRLGCSHKSHDMDVCWRCGPGVGAAQKIKNTIKILKPRRPKTKHKK